MTSEEAQSISEKTAGLADVRQLLDCAAYALLLDEIARARVKHAATALDLSLSHPKRDGAAGAVNALDQIAAFLPALARSLSQTVTGSRAARLR